MKAQRKQLLPGHVTIDSRLNVMQDWVRSLWKEREMLLIRFLAGSERYLFATFIAVVACWKVFMRWRESDPFLLYGCRFDEDVLANSVYWIGCVEVDAIRAKNDGR